MSRTLRTLPLLVLGCLIACPTEPVPEVVPARYEAAQLGEDVSFI